MSAMRPERGFAIPAAIFILVVFAVLGAALVTLTSVSNEETALDVQQTRAFRAAQGGLEWGFYQVRKGTPASCSSAGAEVALDAPTLSGFTVTVTCSDIAVNEAGSPAFVRVTAVACNAPAGDPPRCPGIPAAATYVERVLTGIVTR
ncbi:MAG: hypothetical protein H6R10_2525 [Rhodocyclaceae bacterium]|nr:hypothetical protein [Rhodocyclaceae bacterium]